MRDPAESLEPVAREWDTMYTGLSAGVCDDVQLWACATESSRDVNRLIGCECLRGLGAHKCNLNACMPSYRTYYEDKLAVQNFLSAISREGKKCVFAAAAPLVASCSLFRVFVLGM